MSRDTLIILAVAAGAAYWFLFRKTEAVRVVNVPAPVGNNPTAGATQGSPQDTFDDILKLIQATGNTIGNIVNGTQAQSSAQRY